MCVCVCEQAVVDESTGAYRCCKKVLASKRAHLTGGKTRVLTSKGV